LQLSQDSPRLVCASDVAALFGFSESTLLQMLEGRNAPRQEFYSISEVAHRWRCSRGTVYNRLLQVGAKVLDFAPKGKKGRKAVPAYVLLQIENRQIKRLC
jgi:predicted DNA-binding transcriptional regulator AlpA